MSIKEGNKRASDNLPEIKNRGDEISCPLCNKPLQLIRVAKAANLVDANPRTIYRYIDQGLVYAIKLAGKTYRVCKLCLLQGHLNS